MYEGIKARLQPAGLDIGFVMLSYKVQLITLNHGNAYANKEVVQLSDTRDRPLIP